MAIRWKAVFGIVTAISAIAILAAEWGWITYSAACLEARVSPPATVIVGNWRIDEHGRDAGPPRTWTFDDDVMTVSTNASTAVESFSTSQTGYVEAGRREGIVIHFSPVTTTTVSGGLAHNGVLRERSGLEAMIFRPHGDCEMAGTIEERGRTVPVAMTAVRAGCPGPDDAPPGIPAEARRGPQRPARAVARAGRPDERVRALTSHSPQAEKAIP